MARNNILSELFWPASYHLDLVLHNADDKFVGHLTIQGQKKGRPSQRITLHNENLKVQSAEIIRHDKKGDQVFAVDRINLHLKFAELRLHCQEKLFPGHYTVRVHYQGILSQNELATLAASNPVTAVHYNHYLGNGLRRLLPSIDEADSDASIEVTILKEE